MELLFIAIILILALIAISFSSKSGIPSLLLFLTLGIICSIAGISFDNYEIAESFATIALIVIMFYGGFGTNWKMGKPVVREAAILASLGVVATALITGVFAHYVLKFPLLESMLLGSVVGSTDYASVSNILVSNQLNLKYNTASLLEMESGSNDPFAYTMTMLFLSLVAGTSVSVPMMIGMQIVLGLLLGVLFALLVNKLLKRINLQKDGLAIVFVAAMALLTYSFTSVVGGNGYLAVYLFGIIIGNQTFIGKKDVIFFFDGFTELMSIGLFFLLGLLATPANILQTLPVAAILVLFMTFIARPVSVVGLMLPFRLKGNQLITISWAGLRGAAAIAFAIMVVNSGVELSIDLYHIVFGICFLSSLLQGSFMAPISKKTDMIDPNDTVLTTFNYYSAKKPISFVKTRIKEDSTLVGTRVKDLNMVFDFIIAKIKRDEKSIVPRGEVVLQAGDVLVFSGEEYYDPYGQELIEFSISHGHPWVDHRIMDLNLPEDQLILTIQRGSNFVPAEGSTIIREKDRIILSTHDDVDFNAAHPKLKTKKQIQAESTEETIEK
ncbi:MAG: potassium/proton antiporter [Tissierellia bacterium]|nr:potassium/proton antiporter [Tissierellia bacterium]